MNRTQDIEEAQTIPMRMTCMNGCSLLHSKDDYYLLFVIIMSGYDLRKPFETPEANTTNGVRRQPSRIASRNGQ